jgi:hypothetical protein
LPRAGREIVADCNTSDKGRVLRYFQPFLF